MMLYKAKDRLHPTSSNFYASAMASEQSFQRQNEIYQLSNYHPCFYSKWTGQKIEKDNDRLPSILQEYLAITSYVAAFKIAAGA